MAGKTLIVGAGGQIGRFLVKLCVARGLPIRAMVRTEEQAQELKQLGSETVVADLEGDFAHAYDGCDEVLFTAGSGPITGFDKTLLVDLYGAMRTVEEAKRQGLDRYVMVSAMRAADPQSGPEKLRPYLAAKYAADQFLLSSGVPYVLVRPGRLTDEPATGKVRAEIIEGEITVSRENVALTLAEVLARRELRGVVFDLFDGETPVRELVDSLG